MINFRKKVMQINFIIEKIITNPKKLYKFIPYGKTFLSCQRNIGELPSFHLTLKVIHYIFGDFFF